MLIKINNVDYSNYLVSEYNINKEKEYDEWLDSLGHKHIELKRESIQGSLKLRLYESEYKKFLHNLSLVKTDNFYTISLFCNNTDTLEEIQAYIKFYPVLKKDIDSGKRYDIIEVQIEQK